MKKKKFVSNFEYRYDTFRDPFEWLKRCAFEWEEEGWEVVAVIPHQIGNMPDKFTALLKRRKQPPKR